LSNLIRFILLSGVILTFLPAQIDSTQIDSIRTECSQDHWVGQDKFIHAGISLGLVVGINQMEGMNHRSALAGTFTLGILKEFYDYKYGSGCFSIKDIFANTFGMIVGFIIISNTG
jgi:uncharacterized protein YfiM (DUF2279 family)